MQGSGFRGLRRLPKQGPAATHPVLPKGLDFPDTPPGEFRLGATGRGCGGFPALGVAEEAVMEEELAHGWGDDGPSVPVCH